MFLHVLASSKRKTHNIASLGITYDHYLRSPRLFGVLWGPSERCDVLFSYSGSHADKYLEFISSATQNDGRMCAQSTENELIESSHVWYIYGTWPLVASRRVPSWSVPRIDIRRLCRPLLRRPVTCSPWIYGKLDVTRLVAHSSNCPKNLSVWYALILLVRPFQTF